MEDADICPIDLKRVGQNAGDGGAALLAHLGPDDVDAYGACVVDKVPQRRVKCRFHRCRDLAQGLQAAAFGERKPQTGSVARLVTKKTLREGDLLFHLVASKVLSPKQPVRSRRGCAATSVRGALGWGRAAQADGQPDHIGVGQTRHEGGMPTLPLTGPIPNRMTCTSASGWSDAERAIPFKVRFALAATVAQETGCSLGAGQKVRMQSGTCQRL